MINWEVVAWTCITVAVLVGIAALIITFISARNLKKRSSALKDIHVELKAGSKVMFCGGIYGKVVSVGEEKVQIEVAKNTVIEVSRYAIQDIV